MSQEVLLPLAMDLDVASYSDVARLPEQRVAYGFENKPVTIPLLVFSARCFEGTHGKRKKEEATKKTPGPTFFCHDERAAKPCRKPERNMIQPSQVPSTLRQCQTAQRLRAGLLRRLRGAAPVRPDQHRTRLSAALFCPGLQNPENFLAFRFSERSDWKSTSNFRFASFIASLKPAVLADLSARVQVRIHDYY